jgi:acetyl-CoA carboxylase biotin carboxyl carrier protein
MHVLAVVPWSIARIIARPTLDPRHNRRWTRRISFARSGTAAHTKTRRLSMAHVEAHITGTIWKIECAVGDTIEEGDTVAILESMKMEMPVEAQDGGTVVKILCEEGQAVSEGDPLVELE